MVTCSRRIAMNRVCKKCNEEKEMREFNFVKTNNQVGGIYRYTCKKCEYKDRQQRYINNIDKERAIRIKYYWKNRKEILEWQKEYGKINQVRKTNFLREWRKKNPIRNKAHKLLQNALKKGIIVKPKKCEICNKEKRIIGHHDDYMKPLVVKWICDSCHLKVHGRLSALSLTISRE
jgi:hypothetical protein